MPESPPDIDYHRLTDEELRAMARSVSSEKRRIERLQREGRAFNHGDDTVPRLQEWLDSIHAELRECSCSACAPEQPPA